MYWYELSAHWDMTLFGWFICPKEFLQQFIRVIGKGWQDVLTPPGWPQWRTT